MIRKISMVLVILMSIVLLVACSEDPAAEIEQLVHNYSIGSFDDVSASITSRELIVTDSNDEQKTYPLPEDKFFLSIAPFEEHTHPCEIHNLTGCQGEMINESFSVEIINSEGIPVIEETMKTMDNGFIDLWLPRNDDYHVKMTHDGKTAEATLSTFDNDYTCITTMKLQ